MLVDDAYAAFGDCSDGEFGLIGGADFADQQQVHGSFECIRDVEGDGHAAAGKREHQNIGHVRIWKKLLCELHARLDSVSELHDRFLYKLTTGHGDSPMMPNTLVRN